ncbi:hypothetical protein GCM10027089_01620 [Nocardia thraciensis]
MTIQPTITEHNPATGDHAAVPLAWLGPVRITGNTITAELDVPLATYETPLWPSVRRGARVSTLCENGIVTTVLDALAGFGGGMAIGSGFSHGDRNPRHVDEWGSIREARDRALLARTPSLAHKVTGSWHPPWRSCRRGGSGPASDYALRAWPLCAQRHSVSEVVGRV